MYNVKKIAKETNKSTGYLYKAIKKKFPEIKDVSKLTKEEYEKIVNYFNSNKKVKEDVETKTDFSTVTKTTTDEKTNTEKEKIIVNINIYCNDDDFEEEVEEEDEDDPIDELDTLIKLLNAIL